MQFALDRMKKDTYNVCVAHPGVAQLVARLVRDQEAVGSNPATRTRKGMPPERAAFLFSLSKNFVEFRAAHGAKEV